MKNLSIETPSVLGKNFVIISMDGNACDSLRGFYETIAEALHFPDDFGFTLDSLDDLLNDLSWIEDENLLIRIFNSENFLIKERNRTKVFTLLDMLDATCEDWKWVSDEEPEEDDDLPLKRLAFVFSDSERIQVLLNELYDLS